MEVSFLLVTLTCFAVIHGSQAANATRKYKIRTIVSPPFVIGPDAQDQYSGDIVDILNGLKHDGANDFDWELSARPDNVYGDYFANGTINGLINDVYSGHYDIAVGDLTVTRNRSKVVDFAQQVYLTGTRVAVNTNYDNETAQYFAIPTEGLINYFNKTKFPPAVPIGQSIIDNLPASILDSESEIFGVVQRLANGENVALVGKSVALRRAIAGHTDTIFFTPGAFQAQYYAFAVKLGSDLQRFLSLKIQKLYENGFMAVTQDKSFPLACIGAPKPTPTYYSYSTVPY